MANERAKIILIEGENGLRTSIEKILKLKRYEVVTAVSGHEGIQKFSLNEFDIALIDLNLSDINGIKVLEQFKKKSPSTICFILSADSSYETVMEATRLGAFNFILKPFTPDKLFHQLEKGLKQRQLLLEAEKLRNEREANLLEIAREQSRLNTIIESISSGVLLINRDGKLVYFNRACLQKLQINSLKIEDNILPLMPQEIQDNVSKILEENITDKSLTSEVEIIPNNELVIDATCSPVTLPKGEIAGIAIVLKNITGLKKIEQLKSQFVSMVAHELKTPLTAVLGYLDVLNDDSLLIPKEKQKHYLQRSELRLKSSLDLVNDLLDISRIELNSKYREIIDVDFEEIINQSLELHELDIKKNGIKVFINVENNLPKIKLDKTEASKIITNLLSNAIKYNKVNGKIIINLKASNHYLIIDIKDTGIGLRETDRTKLFQQFFRVKNKYTRSISGTGLGLSIVKRLVEVNHGKISVESEYEKGTKFTILFPFK